MQIKYIILASVLVASISCHKGSTPKPNPPSGGNVVKLKDVSWPHLPSPFYHFEYNNSGDIIHTSFSSELGIYDVIYTGGNITRMESKSISNKDTLKYGYDNGNVAFIRIINKDGINYRRAFLTYTATHHLQTIDWELKDGNAGFVPEQTMQFSYYPDGNLKELVNHHYAVGSQIESLYTDRFENYDNKVNVDAFSLLHQDQHHHLFLIPGVKIQLNNPRRNVRTGDGVTYEIDYSYTYDASGRPLVRTGDVLWTSGEDNGKHYQTQTTFSYYD